MCKIGCIHNSIVCVSVPTFRRLSRNDHIIIFSKKTDKKSVNTLKLVQFTHVNTLPTSGTRSTGIPYIIHRHKPPKIKKKHCINAFPAHWKNGMHDIRTITTQIRQSFSFEPLDVSETFSIPYTQCCCSAVVRFIFHSISPFSI